MCIESFIGYLFCLQVADEKREQEGTTLVCVIPSRYLGGSTGSVSPQLILVVVLEQDKIRTGLGTRERTIIRNYGLSISILAWS